MIVAQPKEEIEKFVRIGLKETDPFKDYSALGYVRENRLIAGVIYNHYTKSSICMHVYAVGRNWLTKSFLFACFDYPFNQLGVNVITGLVAKKNKAARQFDEHLGFIYQGKIPHALPHDDLLIYTLIKRDCRWLSLGSKKPYAIAA